MEPESTEKGQSNETTKAASMTGSASTADKSSGPFSGGLGIFVFLVLFCAAGYLTYKTLFTAEPPTPEPLPVKFMCSETGKVFEYKLKPGETIPVVSPETNRRTGYPVEACYWTRDDKRKVTPTYVILNSYLGKKGDTICPDCGRVIVGHNPRPPADVPLATTRPVNGPGGSGRKGASAE